MTGLVLNFAIVMKAKIKATVYHLPAGSDWSAELEAENSMFPNHCQRLKPYSHELDLLSSFRMGGCTYLSISHVPKVNAMHDGFGTMEIKTLGVSDLVSSRPAGVLHS
jgi:hypothetical protein